MDFDNRIEELYLYNFNFQLEKKRLVNRLKKIGVIQFGEFILKSGQKSNVYFDMRKIYSHPNILKMIILMFCHQFEAGDIESSEYVCGIPSAGIPYASFYSCHFNRPLIMVRKEKKDHGTGKLVEGDYQANKSVNLFEDVTTTGGSIQEIVDILEKENLHIYNIYVILDRRPPEKRNELIGGVQIKSLLTMEDIIDI